MILLPHLPSNPATQIGDRPSDRKIPACCDRAWAVLVTSVFLMVFSAQCLYAQAAGIVIYKDNSSQSESSAKVFEFTAIRRLGAVTRYIMTNGGKVDLNQYQPQSVVLYPNWISGSITDPGQLGPIAQDARLYRETVKKYQLAASFLNLYIQTADDMISHLKEGQVLFNGQWMAKSTYEAQVHQEDDKAKELIAKGNEKKRTRDEQARRLDMETRRHKQ